MTKRKTSVLVLGATGMLGSALFRAFSKESDLITFGTMREVPDNQNLPVDLREAMISNTHFDGELGLLRAFSIAKPDIVINCIGVIKQMPAAKDYLESIAINSTLPHRLAKYCDTFGARLVHFSTDCVFSGEKGLYEEDDFPDADDLYGRTKLLGEVIYENSITLRTSIIGHELKGSKSLIDWFLSQSGEVKGFTKAIFSGLPTVEIARVIKEYVMPNQNLTGLYHLSVDPISKFDLLSLVAQKYKKIIRIIPDDKLIIDRSLNSDRFRTAASFRSKSWLELIDDMHAEYMSNHAKKAL